MSMLADLASSTSVLIWGPPAPVAKDPPPAPPSPVAQPKPKRNSVSSSRSPPLSPSSRKARLLSPNLGLPNQHHSPKTMAKSKSEPLPPPPPPAPEEEHVTATSIGASALSLLGSAVIGLGSAAVSALSSVPSEADVSPTKAPPSSDTEAKEESSLLGALGNAVLSRAASVRDAALETASNTASAAAHAVADSASSALGFGSANKSSSVDADLNKATAAGEGAVAKKMKRASTLPVQLTASGEPFSDDPSVSAMQRIPDHPCGHVHAPGRNPLLHCCSAPDVLSTVGEEGGEDCTCKCYTLDKDRQEKEGVGKQEDGCECICHTKTTTSNKGQGGHFHRVEQLVKGTKRVVRDIKNVL